MIKTAVIIGFGNSGQRFFDVIKERKDIEVIAVVDPDAKKTLKLKSKIRTFISIQKFIESGMTEVDYFIISTIDKDHYSNIIAIKDYFRFSFFIVEKPLTKNIWEAKELLSVLGDENLAINFVERFSTAIQEVKKFIASKHLTPIRVITFWGKNRLGDDRDTMGVYSEISHSIDLIIYLCEVKNFNSNQMHSIKLSSDFNGAGTLKDDTLLLNMNVDLDNSSILCTFQSSFMWYKRKREIILFLKSPEAHCYMISIDLDNPRWDYDHYEIKIFKNGEWVKVTEKSITPQNHRICGNEKINRFISEILSEKRKDKRIYATLSDGMLVQKVLHYAENKGNSNGTTKFYN